MTDLFDRIPAFRSEAVKEFDCREDCFLRIYENTTKDEVKNWTDSLVRNGFEILLSRELYGNIYYELEKDVTVTAYYTPCDGSARITVSGKKRSPNFKPVECERKCGTTFYVFENDHSLIDCGMCLIMQCPDYSFFVVDSGHYLQFNDNDRIYNFMRERTPEGQKVVVNGWLLTHAHTDHISKFMDFLRYNMHDVVIEGIYSNLMPADYPNDKWGNEEKELAAKLFDMLEKVNIPKYKIHAGQRIYIRNLAIDVLGTHEDVCPDFIEDFNDSSCIVMVEAEDSRVFIPGDASALASRQLEARYGENLKCDVVQVSHHGHRGLSLKAYELLNPRLAVFPITRIKFDEEYPKIEVNRRLIELADRYYISSDGTVEIPLPFDLSTVKTLPDESFEDFPKIKRLWHYDYTNERKEELYSIFLEHGGKLDKFVIPTSPKGNFDM